ATLLPSRSPFPRREGGQGGRSLPLQEGTAVLSIRELRVTYAGGVQAVRGVDLDVAPGEAVAVVGESGCGKSTLATAVLRLLPETATVTGSVRLAGVDVYAESERDVKRVRGQLAGLVVQDPMNSFNPVMRVGAHIVEARRLHDRTEPARRLWPWAVRLLDDLRIPEAARRARHYPHEWSGGMLQRAAIAAASANRPHLLLADEPTASLDASLAVDVVHGLRERQQREGAAMVLITHQLGLAAQVADRMAVMYAGRIVEIGPAAQVIARPCHPYTRALVAAMPRPGAGLPEPLEGELPSLAPPPPGCAFSARCRFAVASCAAGPAPDLVDGVACPVVMEAQR
ncbi:MAG: ABC transporter ATP-binding protein, partial [Chloroflexota bacterium]